MEQARGRERGWLYLGLELALRGLTTDDGDDDAAADDNGDDLFPTYYMPGTRVDDLWKLS